MHVEGDPDPGVASGEYPPVLIGKGSMCPIQALPLFGL